MGLDAVEIVMRAEELFVIRIEDDEAGWVQTIADLYNLICEKLSVVPLQAPVTSATLPTIAQEEKKFWFLYKTTPQPAPTEVLPWTPQTVWDCLVAIFVDQQHLPAEEILPHARWHDLGID